MYVIGIDIGTSSCKSIIVDSNGKVIASATKEYPIYTPKPGWAEQEPIDWWNATVETIQKIISDSYINPKSIKGIGLSGQMHGLIGLNKNYEVIRPALLWNDQRAYRQCIEIYDSVGGKEELLKYTNNSMLPGYTAAKILWLKEEEPDNFRNSVIFLNPKDYIRFRLTNEFATEVSDASGTGLLDVKNRRWNKKLLDILKIPCNLLPKCFESQNITGYITDIAASKIGLPKSIPVVGGGGDAVIQTIGSGLINEGVLGITIGTAGIVAACLNNYSFNSTGKLQIFCNNMPDKWHIMGVTLAAGSSIQWFKNTLCKYESKQAKKTGHNVYETINKEIEKESEPGSKNMIFLPYLMGERCPYSDPNAKGVFIGATLRHTHSDFARSIMEGVSFSLKQVYQLMQTTNINLSPKEIIASGGGASSNIWKRILADVFQLPIKTVSGSRYGGAYGAALIAGTGLGIWGSIKESTNFLKVENEILPDRKNYTKYDNLFNIYQSLYNKLKNSFEDLSEI